MIYIQRSDNALVIFDGMTQEQITTMLQEQGLTCTFLTQDDYNAALAALQS